jgi:hypothetical protein
LQLRRNEKNPHEARRIQSVIQDNAEDSKKLSQILASDLAVLRHASKRLDAR